MCQVINGHVVVHRSDCWIVDNAIRCYYISQLASAVGLSVDDLSEILYC